MSKVAYQKHNVSSIVYLLFFYSFCDRPKIIVRADIQHVNNIIIRPTKH